MNYDLKITKEKVAGLTLKLEQIADLNATIDKLCDEITEGTAPSEALEELCPYFGFFWPASRALAEHLAQMGGWLRGRSVVELGCGLAVPAIVAAKLGARTVASDFHEDAPKFLKRNCALNGVAVEYHGLDWKDGLEGAKGESAAHAADAATRASLAAMAGTFDFVVASDVLYEARQPPQLARVADALCAKEGHILLADPGRPYLQNFVDELKKRGYRADTFTRGEIFILSFS